MPTKEIQSKPHVAPSRRGGRAQDLASAIREVVADLNRAADGCDDPVGFLGSAFQTCCQRVGVDTAAYWMLPANEPLKLVEQIGFSSGDLNLIDSSESELGTSIRNVFKTHQTSVVNADAGAFLLLPIRGTGRVKAVFSLRVDDSLDLLDVEVLSGWDDLAITIEVCLEQVVAEARRQRPGIRWVRVSADQPQSIEIESEPPAQEPFDQPTAAKQMQVAQAEKLLRFAAVVGKSIDEKAVAYDVVNELRSVLEFGRIGISIVRGQKCKLLALSGIETFDSRSAIIIALQRLATKVAMSGVAVWHPEEGESLPPRLAECFQQYYEHSDALSVALIPIHATKDRSRDPENLADTLRNPDEVKGELIAVLSIEGLNRQIERLDVEPTWELASTLVANAIHNAVRHSSIFLYPLWAALGDGLKLFRGHHRNKAIAISSAIALALIVLMFFPSKLQLRSEGVIQPALQSRIYAEVSGTVAEIFVKEGAMVENGEPLLQLRSPEFDLEFEKARSEVREARSILVAIRDQLNSTAAIDEHTSRTLRKERASREEQLRTLEAQLELLKAKKQKMLVTTPRSGKIITWDVSQRLNRRPVEPGQHLLTVADEVGPWELELKLPDKRTGHLRKALSTRGREKPLAVNFVLASDPTRVHRGYLKTLANSQTFDEQEGSVLRIYIEIDQSTKEELGLVNPGTEVIAHIEAGNQSLGYCLLFEFFDWVNRTGFKYLW